MQHHGAQLRICHEHIGEAERDKQGRYQWCELPASDWCFDCGFYVCEMHASTRHEFHQRQTVALEREDAAGDQGERRKGQRRK